MDSATRVLIPSNGTWSAQWTLCLAEFTTGHCQHESDYQCMINKVTNDLKDCAWQREMLKRAKRKENADLAVQALRKRTTPFKEARHGRHLGAR